MSERKRVLIMISSLDGGGAERVATRLASGLSQHHDVFLMPFSKTRNPYPMAPEVHVVDMSLYDLRDRKRRVRQLARDVHTALHVFPRIWSFRKRERIDATISMLLVPNVLNVLAGPCKRKILSERNNPSRKGKLRFALSKWVYRHGSCVVFQTDRIRKLFSRRVQERGVVIPNLVTVERSAADVRTKTIVTAGRLVPQKHHAMLIRAFARFHEAHPEHELRIFGEGPLRAKLEALVAELGLEACVHLEGRSDHLHDDIATAQMLVLCSNYEGMPNALLEAMAMGIACISTSYPAAEELVTNEENALVVPCDDEEALARAMARIADDDALRARLEAGALKRSRDFSPEVILPQWEALL